MLAESASAVGSTLMRGTAFVGCHRSDVGWSVRLATDDDDVCRSAGSVVSARMVIDATGRSAQVAQRVGARRGPLDQLVGVAVEVDATDVANGGYVLVESTADGWWYSAPVPGNRIMTMLMTDGDLWRRAAATSMPTWTRRLATTSATRERVASGKPLGPVRVISAMSQRLGRPLGSAPWLAVGDAALAVDPISGSGVVRALRMARSAAVATVALLDAGDAQAIPEYEAERDLDWAKYQHERSMYYALEGRWDDRLFWRRRQPGAEVAQSRTAVEPGLIGEPGANAVT